MEVSQVEERFREIDGRLDKVESRQEKLERDLKGHEIEFAEMKVYVKEIYKRMDSISLTLEAMKSYSASKWDNFLEKSLWVGLGFIGTYIATKFNLK
jgi:predicted  nucleic acid-binding Zn-ribbon protein